MSWKINSGPWALIQKSPWKFKCHEHWNFCCWNWGFLFELINFFGYSFDCVKTTFGFLNQISRRTLSKPFQFSVYSERKLADKKLLRGVEKEENLRSNFFFNETKYFFSAKNKRQWFFCGSLRQTLFGQIIIQNLMGLSINMSDFEIVLLVNSPVLWFHCLTACFSNF